ncbi:MAG TPA: hypothetical protein VN048_09120 [Verrucomicrobiae bacterium]|nr:hypothetical protein [Verrucomicrobiae bacterium]
MEASPTSTGFRQISVLLRGEPEPINAWIQQWNPARALLHVGVIVAGTGLYGAAMGYWRDPLQALFVAVKFPLIILMTTLGNGLLNGMLAPLLGLNLSFRQCLQSILMSHTITAAILGAFSPVMFFMIWNAPLMSAHDRTGYDFIMLGHVLVIAFAGMAGNLRLGRLLAQMGGSVAVGRRVLFAWLAGNLLLGSQLSWILRPFIGAPDLPVQFLRKEAFNGNFFETIFRTVHQLLSS